MPISPQPMNESTMVAHFGSTQVYIDVLPAHGLKIRFGHDSVTFSGDQLAMAKVIAKIMEHAHANGMRDARREMRKALGITGHYELWVDQKKDNPNAMG